MTHPSDILNRKYYREQKAREEAEKLLEEKSLELYEANEELKLKNQQLKNLVDTQSTKLTARDYEYKTLVESISDIICRTRLDGIITFINPIVTLITGYKPEEIIGTNILNFIAPENKKQASIYYIRQFLKKRCLSYREFEIVTKSSKRIWMGLNVQFFLEKCASCDIKMCALANCSTSPQGEENCNYKEIIVVARDATRQKQTEDLLIRQSRNLEAGFKQQELLSEIAIQLNSLDDFSNKMNNFLRKIGEDLKVSRVYIFEDNDDGITTSNTYEWCNTGVTPQKDDLQGIPYSMIPSWKKILSEKGFVYSENISELPKDLRDILEPQQIKSIVVYPLFVQSFFFGFIGFDECTREKKWQKTELELLKTLSGMIANAYERKVSEKHLKESEEKNKAILSSIPDILMHFDKEGTILGYHSATQKDLALPPHKFLGKKVTEIFPANFGNKIILAINQCLKIGNFQFNYDMDIRGEQQYFESRMSRMNKNEVIAIIRNVSDRIRYEQELTIERDKANMANKAKSEFLANMSHEFRTPMNAVLGFSEALYQRVKDPQNKRMLKSILNSGNLLLSLINDILDLSKIEAGKLEIKPQPTNLKGILDEINILFTTKATQKEIPLNINFDNDFPDNILLDEIRIKQIIFNLVGNALKFTNAGYVNISAKFEKQSNKNGTVILTVEDTGIGIPESEQESIFDAFKQQSGQSNRKYEGTGLGLSISKKLTEKMGGTLTVKSQVKKGSVFKLEIPNVQIVSRSDITEQYVEENIKNIRFPNATIMIVDDVQTNIDLLKTILFGKQVDFITADNGITALSLLKEFKPDLIILDILMPDMDGFEVASRIRKDPSRMNIPIIAFTASPSATQNSENKNLFNGILYKPITRNKLYSELKKYLKHEFVEAAKSTETKSDNNNLAKELSSAVKSKLPEIIDIIESKIIPMWNNVKDTFVLYRIEEFIKEVHELSVQYDFIFLDSYAKKLQDDMEIIDLESLRTNLMDFPNIIKNIKEYITVNNL